MNIGQTAPQFNLEGSQGPIALRTLLAKGPVAVYFVREFGCHTCMHHAIELNKLKASLEADGVQLVLIGGGSAEQAKKSADRYKLAYPVLADKARSVFGAYGYDKSMLVLQKSGITLIDADGKIAYQTIASNPSQGLDREGLLAASAKVARKLVNA